MNKILATLFLTLTLAGCTTSAPQRVAQSTQIDLTQYIGHDEKEVVALMTQQYGVAKERKQVHEQVMYWFNTGAGVASVLWVKDGKLYGFGTNAHPLAKPD